MHLEPIYDSFVCPLTKKVMRDPVTLENGLTFEREAIEKWFKDCREKGRKPTCPSTLKELHSIDLNPSIALRNTIEEWTKRNEAAQIDIARRSLSSGSLEADVLQALDYIHLLCKRSKSHKQVVRHAGLIPMISEMLKSTSSKVRFRSLETLRIVAEGDADNKDAIAVGDTIRTIVKFLSHDHSQEREEAVFLLYELSKSESLSEKIGDVYGSILILVGMASSKSENVLTVKRAEKTLENLETCEKNVRQMAGNGRLQPLLRLLLKGSPETKLAMAEHLGELALSNDVKLLVAQTAGASLIEVLQSGSKRAKEVALKALNQISSYEASAKILVKAGILPPLIRDLFTEISATILADIVASGADFVAIPLGDERQTLVSEGVVHNLLHLISNTGPAIECKLLQVLVGLTSSPRTVESIVAVVRSSGAVMSLIQFIQVPQRDLRMAAIKLLHNVSPFMGQELADAFRNNAGQLGSLIRIIADNGGASEEQAAAVGLLAELPEQDSGLTRRLLAEEAFEIIIQKGLVRVLSRVTFLLQDEPAVVKLCQENNLGALFSEMLQKSGGQDRIQAASALALEHLSQQSRPARDRICRVHRGLCSMRDSFCLVEGQAVDKLVACLDHENERVVEAALAAICTLLEDGQDIEAAVQLLAEDEGVKLILEVLVQNRSEVLRHRAVWAAERILRTDDIANEVSGNQNIVTAIVEAFRNSDNHTKQLAEKALKHIDRLPRFSGIFPRI
ncbi:unnamed protein product [Spirodela intermedia]|uniref:RING-type E3 ubiquitin transferase n=1 Tax=Spirodela intermedia TaxID=51605 RepID=A0A7I8IKX2_SPIIN|nr:unnamed protein product [Spirodela intermedia]CAA6658513.1 unnamed protein product [Spirodela intermedia]